MINKNTSIIISSIFIGILAYTVQDKGVYVNIEQIHGETKIDLAEVLQLMKNPYTLVVDTRELTYYKKGHLPRAMNIQPAALADCLPTPIMEAVNIIIYGDESNAMADLLRNRGLNNYQIYAEGWREWSSCELPFDKEEDIYDK